MWLFSPHLKLQHYSPGTAACGFLKIFFTSAETAALFTWNCCMWLFSSHLKLQHYSLGTAACGFFHLTWNCSINHLELLHVAFFTLPETAVLITWNCCMWLFSPHLKLQHVAGLHNELGGGETALSVLGPLLASLLPGQGWLLTCTHIIHQWPVGVEFPPATIILWEVTQKWSTDPPSHSRGNTSSDKLQGADIRFPKCG